MDKQPFENLVQHLFQLAAHAEFKDLKDKELLKRYVEQRDGLAFGELIRRYKGMIWYVCWCVLRHHQDVEDAFQAIVMTLLHRANTLLEYETIEGWLHSTAFHVASKAKRNRERRRAREQRSVEMQFERPDHPKIDWEMGEIINKELLGIPEKLRRPLIMCYLEGLTQKKAADLLGISLKNLEQRLHRGREQLKNRLSKYDMDWSASLMLVHPVPGVNIPLMPPRLMEKTLEMVRIVTLSNGALEATGISAEVALLTKAALGAWSLKAKVLLGTFVLSLVSVSVGTVLYTDTFTCLFRGRLAPDGASVPALRTVDEPYVDYMLPRVDRYGDLLPPGALVRGGTVRLRHVSTWKAGGAEAVLFTRDGQALFTTGSNDPVRLWDVASGQLLREFGEKNSPVQGPTPRGCRLIALSPDGATLASSAGGRRLYLWQVATGKLLDQWDTERIAALSFSPDGTMLLTVGDGNVLSLREVATGLEQRRCVLERCLFDSEIWFAISPNGKYAVSVCDHKIVQWWDIATGKMVHELPCAKTELGSPAFVAFSPDSKFLATASAAIEKDIEQDADSCDGAVHVWDVATGKEVRQIGCDKAGTWSVAFSPDGKILATGSGAGPIRLWDMATGQKLRECQNYRSHIASLAFSRDGQRLASGASMIDHTARVWEVATGLEIGRRLWGGHISAVNSLTFSSDGQTVVSAGNDGRVGAWDATTGRELRPPLQAGDFHAFARLLPDGKTIASIASVFSPNGKPFRLEALRSPTVIRLWDTATGTALRHFMGLDVKTHSMSMSSNGQAIVCIAYSGSHLAASLWDMATGKGSMLSDGLGTDMPLCAVFSPDSKLVAIGSFGGVVSFWDVATCKKMAQYQVHKGWVESLVFAPDGRTLATAGSDTFHVGDGNTDLCQLNRPTLRLWRCPPTSSGSLEAIHMVPMSGHRGRIYELAFSPDGRSLASAGQDGTVRLWETATGKERRCFTEHQGEVWCLAFAPDGRRLASGGNDTTFLVWDVTGRLDHGRLRPAHLSTSHMEQLWTDLAGSDAVRAGQAMWTLTAAGSAAVSFLQGHLRPAAWGPSEPMVSTPLSESDTSAVAVHQQALKQPEVLEVTTPQDSSGELLRDLRAIEVLEQIRSPEARRLLKLLSTGSPKSRQTQEAKAAFYRLYINK